MEDEIASLRQQLLEAQRLREEEQRLREMAEEKSKPKTLQAYLDSCHLLGLAMKVVTQKSMTTQGHTTNPTGRIFPRRIIPWDDFTARQEDIWDQLSVSSSFSSEAMFPSQNQMDYVMSKIRPISSEDGLRNFELLTVEHAVEQLVNEVYNNTQLRSAIGLKGTVTFESHTNLGQSDDVSEAMEKMSIDGSVPSRSSTRKPQRKARGKGNRADQFCIQRTSDGQNTPVLAIEYKAPHKLKCLQVVTGLASEIQPERDVINKDGEDFAFASRSLLAAVITQLFSYMIGKGIRYGYVCTGEAFVFLRILNDPASVYYSVCVPHLDVVDGDENRLQGTAVAQVFAFILQALRDEPPTSSWYDAAAALDLWEVEYEDVLAKIPQTVLKGKQPRPTPYKPQSWRGFKRSPIRTRAQCKQPDNKAKNQDDKSDDEDETPPSPTPKRLIHAKGKAATTSKSAGLDKNQAQDSKDGQQESQKKRQDIKDRPYCSAKCLLGLVNGGPMDKKCQNRQDHADQHLDRLEFLRLIRIQLAEDRGRGADATPLYLAGSIGALFKVRLSSHGYTLVAKGVESLDLARLQHENDVYDRLGPIQGKHVPVCLGSIDMILPLYYDCGVYKHLLFLSWAGRPLFVDANTVPSSDVVARVVTAYKELHKLGVLHGDAEPRNILRDPASGQIKVVDFERAELGRSRTPLGSLGANGQAQKRKRGEVEKQGQDGFARELRGVVGSVSQFMDSVWAEKNSPWAAKLMVRGRV